jgi:hypothetical protein
VFSEDKDEIQQILLPDDDDSDKSRETLEIIYQRHEVVILEIAKQLGLDISQPNMVRRVISHCHRQNDYFWFISSKSTDKSFDDIENCIIQMRELNKKDPTDMMKFQNICNYIGLEYRREYLRK